MEKQAAELQQLLQKVQQINDQLVPYNEAMKVLGECENGLDT